MPKKIKKSVQVDPNSQLSAVKLSADEQQIVDIRNQMLGRKVSQNPVKGTCGACGEVKEINIDTDIPELCYNCLRIVSKDYLGFANNSENRYASSQANNLQRLNKNKDMIRLYSEGLIDETTFRSHFNFVEDDITDNNSD